MSDDFPDVSIPSAKGAAPTSVTPPPVGRPPVGAKWKPVTIANQIVLRGGYHDKPILVDTTEVMHNGLIMTFVIVNKNEEWLVKAATGPKGQKGALSRSKIVQQLKDNLKNQEDVDDAADRSSSGSADAAERDADARDPMHLLDGVVPNVANKKRLALPGRAYTRKRRRVIREVECLEEPTCSNPKKLTIRKVKILAVSTNALAVSVDDIAWLVRYVADEISFGGVEFHPHDDGDGAGEDGSAVADGDCSSDFQVRWDFHTGDAWQATFLRGPQEGVSYRSVVIKLTDEKWAEVAGNLGFSGTLQDADHEQRKTATRHFLECACKKMLAETPAVEATA